AFAASARKPRMSPSGRLVMAGVVIASAAPPAIAHGIPVTPGPHTARRSVMLELPIATVPFGTETCATWRLPAGSAGATPGLAAVPATTLATPEPPSTTTRSMRELGAEG